MRGVDHHRLFADLAFQRDLLEMARIIVRKRKRIFSQSIEEETEGISSFIYIYTDFRNMAGNHILIKRGLV